MTASGRKVIIVLGPTAVGKTRYAIDLALKVGSPVISCDSRQIYREMTIGTAVPSPDELDSVRHYFIQDHSVCESYNAGQYELDAVALCEKLFSEGHDTLVMCGGSGLYIDAFCRGLDSFPDADPAVRAELSGIWHSGGIEKLAAMLKEVDPESYDNMDISNGQRVVRALEVWRSTGRKFSSFKTSSIKPRSFEIEKIGLRRPLEELYRRIDTRVDSMVGAGLVDEARRLYPLLHGKTSCIDVGPQALRTVGYKEFFDFFEWEKTGEGDVTSIERAVELVKRNTRHYARKQLSYWRRDSSINWIDL